MMRWRVGREGKNNRKDGMKWNEKKEQIKGWKQCLKKGKNEWMKGSEETRMKEWN